MEGADCGNGALLALRRTHAVLRLQPGPAMDIFAGLVIGALLTLFLSNFSTGEKKLERRVEALYGVDDDAFVRSMGSLVGPSLLGGNRIEPLQNGHQIFPAMIEAIASAQKTITFETFIYWSGQIGRDFAEALAERARAGVKVHVLLDWVGTNKMDRELLDMMDESGIEVRRYHPLRWYNVGRLNNRTHRKLLVVDGKIGFTGGVGIADVWLGDAEDPAHWRDMHYRATGPVVAQMQSAFADNWLKTAAVLLHGNDYFPPLEQTGDHSCQMFKSSANEGAESARLMYMLSIASARRRVLISSAYFVPDDLAIGQLCDAVRRGVEVHIMVPGEHIDTAVTRRASRSRWGALLKAGVHIYEYQPTMLHMKLMVIDDCWASVGSTNFDNRSFRLNDEANLNILDRGFANDQAGMFLEDMKRTREITYEQWKSRPLWEKITERLAGVLRSQL